MKWNNILKSSMKRRRRTTSFWSWLIGEAESLSEKSSAVHDARTLEAMTTSSNDDGSVGLYASTAGG